MERNLLCVICGETLNVGKTVLVTKGLQTLINTSRTRQDGLHVHFSEVNSLNVHSDCRKHYTMPSSIAKATSQYSHATPCERNRTSKRTEDSGFNFKTNCLFCGEEASVKVETKKAKKYRKVIHQIETLESLNNLKKKAEERKDDKGETVLRRISSVIDLVAAEGKYHENCYASFLTNPLTDKTVGRPVNIKMRSAFIKLCEFIDGEDECQYSGQDLFSKLKELTTEGEEVYSIRQIKDLLKEKYGESVNIVNGRDGFGKDVVFTFMDGSKKLLYDAWYEKREQNELEERKRIITMAAKIIREDIQLQLFDNQSYPQPENMLEDPCSPVPETLKLLIDHITKSKTMNHKVQRKRIMVCHSIISMTRPKTFVSPLLLACGVYCLRHFASRQLIDILHSLGMSASYNEIRRFEFSCMNAVPPQTLSHFTQWVFDNADFNIRTLDGHNTFHCMGGIRISTPPEELVSNKRIPRLKNTSAKTIADMGKRDILTYSQKSNSGLSDVVVKSILISEQNVTNLEMAKFSNRLWLCLHLVKNAPEPMWNGFMNAIYKNVSTTQSDTSSIVPVPFFSHPASDINTIYSTLVYATEECKNLGQNTCIVTYDQPLFWKAMQIVTSAETGTPLANVVVRLGGFHLLMSYLGTIGYLMAGSGIEELWGLLYSKQTIEKMMTGHAYSRALRAHFLTYITLFQKLLQHSLQELDDNSKSNIREAIHELMMTNKSHIEDLQNNSCIKQLVNSIETALENENFSRTGKLWLQYMEQITLILLYIQADRAGNWELHLYTIKSMMPYFHAAGHIFYAKCAHLYIQQMEELVGKMDNNEFKNFVDGYFTIRRKDRAWSGVAPDMIIEQSLMKSMKVAGGLTQGRGMEDSTLSRWIASFPINMKISEVLEAFCGKTYICSEQHVEFRPSRQSRDDADLTKLSDWLLLHNPFDNQCPKHLLINIASGLVADDKTNCDDAKNVGETLLSSITGCSFAEVKLQRKKRAIPISATNNTLVIRNSTVIFNPLQLFTRIAAVLRSKENLRDYLKYELAPQPPSLFDEVSMRKNVKSTLASIIETIEPCVETPSPCLFIVDGGFLLHAVIWNESDTYKDICLKYVKFVQKRFSPCEAVVFDGYSCALSTKSVERQRRLVTKMSATIAFDDNMVATTKQAIFLRNSENKSRLIQMVMGYFQSEGITVLQADDDADTLICSTAINASQNSSRLVAIIGTDTDLLTILIARSNPEKSLFFLRPQTSNYEQKCYDISKIQKSLGSMKDSILFLHAATGCDTTSAIFRKGKSSAFKLVKKNHELLTLISQFNNPELNPRKVIEIGEIFMKCLFGGEKLDSLDELRFICYNKEVTKNLSSKFRLAVLPPTSAATSQHSLRVYLQVQQWLGKNLDPTEWGWFMKEGKLNPVPSTLPAAPDELLQLISCDCKITAERDCDEKCQCKKAALQCSRFCTSCLGETCTNSVQSINEFDDDDLQIDDTKLNYEDNDYEVE